MALPWMTQLSEHGAGSKSSLLKAAEDLLREIHQELQEESGSDPGCLSLLSIGPMGERELIKAVGGGESLGTPESREEGKEFVLTLRDPRSDRRIEVGIFKAAGLDPTRFIRDFGTGEESGTWIPDHGRRFGRLLLLLHLYREVCLSEALNRVRAQLRAESNPYNIRRFSELREILHRFTDKVVETLDRRDILCYLRRSYLPYETGDERWKNRFKGYYMHLPPAAIEIRSKPDWERYWDSLGETLETADEVATDFSSEPEEGVYQLYSFPLLTVEATEQESVEEGLKRRRFYGALCCFSRAPYGYLDSEWRLLKSFSEDLGHLVRDCEIQHHMALHDQLLDDLNPIESSDEILETSAKWFKDLYCPTEIAVLRVGDNNYLNLVYEHGVNRLMVPPLDILSEPGGVLRAARERKVDYIPTTSVNPNYLPVNPETRSQIAVPLYAGEILMGILLLGFPIIDAIGPADRLLIFACSFRIAAVLWRVERSRRGTIVVHKMKEILPILRDNFELLARTKDPAKVKSIVERCLKFLSHWEPMLLKLTDAIYHDATGVEHFNLQDMLERLVNAPSGKEEKGLPLIELVKSQGSSYQIRGREQAFEMAFDALLSNAKEAMHQKGGKVTIRVREQTGRNERRFAVVRVEDEGPGVPETIQNMVFEPLFTTKSGHSRGLGLFIARGVFEGVGGTLRLIPATERPDKKGAAFEAQLPISNA